MEETIIKYQPQNLITVFMTSSYFDMEIVNDFEVLDSNTTRLFASAKFVRIDWMMKIIFFFSSKKKTQHDHKTQIKKLKALIETEA